MKLQKIKAKKVFADWDIELNKFGVWIFIGSIGCLSLPCSVGIISLIFLIVIGAKQAKEKNVKPLKKIDSEKRKKDISKKKKAFLDKFENDRKNIKRNNQIYCISVTFAASSLTYILAKILINIITGKTTFPYI